MSCDNIGGYTPPKFHAEFKKDPYHIPGYQGFVPQFQYRSEGKTIANASKKLFEDPCVASSGKLVLADVSRPDGASIIKPGFECKVMGEEMKRCRNIRQRCLPGCYPEMPAQYPQPYMNSLQPADVAYRAPVSVAIPVAITTVPMTRNCNMPVRQVPKGAAVHSNLTDDLKTQFKKEYLICPAQTVYDPNADCRYFMFHQQNSRNCGKPQMRPVPSGACVSMSQCKEICPCPQTQLKIRQLYPECGGMMSGYGGHVPGFNDCTLGENYKKATAKVLKQMVGGKRVCPGPWKLKLPNCDKNKKRRTTCDYGCGSA